MDKFLKNLGAIWSKTNRFHRVVLLFIILEVQPFAGGKYGFYCKDPALSHPFTGDTISWKWLMSVCSLLPFVVMLIVERKYHNIDKDRPKKRALRWYKEYLFGYILNLCIVQLLKFIVGSPRPHFFDTCNPKEATLCAESEYVFSYTCTSTVWNQQSDKSFPSGHTSLAFHAGFFIAYYLHKRMSAARPVTGACQALSVGAATWCAASRMWDHRHHWWDVLAGACIGAVVLLYTIRRLCNNFQCATKKVSASGESNTKVFSNGESNTSISASTIISNGEASPSKEIVT